MPPRKRTSASSKTAAKTAPTRRRTSTVTASPYGAPELIVVADPAAALRIGTRGVESGGGADTRALNRVAARADRDAAPAVRSRGTHSARGPQARPRGDRPGPRPVGLLPRGRAGRRSRRPRRGARGQRGRPGRIREAGERTAGPQRHGTGRARTRRPPRRTSSPTSSTSRRRRAASTRATRGPGRAAAAPGVSIIDCEWGWRFDHEDLTVGQGGVVVGTASTDTNHGTAVIGEISGDRNAFGITGICPDAFIRAAAFSGPTAATIHSAADQLGAGDIILLEIHRAGPRHNFQARSDQLGYIAIEWWPDDFDAIRYANSRGIIVVEAAGNGAENLDDALYAMRPAGFPNSWTNPFNRANRDPAPSSSAPALPRPGPTASAGAPTGPGSTSPTTAPSSTPRAGAARSHDRATAICRAAATRGSGTRTTSPGPPARPRSSSASSARLQGALRAAGKTPMTPATARAWLRATGSPQQDEPGRPATQRIGNRPDLKALIQAHVKGNIAIDKATFKDAKDVKIEQKEFKNEKAEIKERKEKIEVKEHKREAKEFKNEKAEIKERKEKIEVIEGKHVIVDGGGKNLIVEGGGGGKQLVEGGGGGIGGGGIDPASAAGGGVEARLAAVEQSVAALTHFIGADLRPDLGSGALAREADLSAEPDAPKSFKDSKDSKDMKDQENLGGY